MENLQGYFGNTRRIWGYVAEMVHSRRKSVACPLSLEPSLIWHMQLLPRAPLGHLAAPVIAGRGIGVRVAHEFLHRHQIHAGIEEIAGEGTPDVVGRKT